MACAMLYEYSYKPAFLNGARKAFTGGHKQVSS